MMQSVTQLVSKQFKPFNAMEVIENMKRGKNWNESNKYWNMTDTEIMNEWRKSTTEGTQLHAKIEQFYKTNISSHLDYIAKDFAQHIDVLSILESKTIENKDVSWKYFLNFVIDTPNYNPYKAEWFVKDMRFKVQGKVDMVYLNDDGTLTLYDWKRAKDLTKYHMDEVTPWMQYSINEKLKHIPDMKIWHYALQLNIYKAIIERNYSLIVKDMYILSLHPENPSTNYDIIKIPDLQTETYIILESLLS